MNLKEQTKVNWNISKYKKSLDKSELSKFKSLSKRERDYLVLFYLNNEPINLNDNDWLDVLNNRINEHEYTDTVDKEITEEESDYSEAKRILGSYMAKKGLVNLTYETQKLLADGNYKSSLDSFQSGLAKISGNPYQNTLINTSIGQLDTNLAQIKLIDNLIKDNQIIKEQNEEIINLLRIIAEK